MAQLTYEKVGVPHLKGNAAYNRTISKLIRSTHISGVRGSSTGFAALFDLQKTGVKNPLLVSSTDGVGTKLEIAMLQKKHHTIGIDLVAMCVNDILSLGARPLFFLDYFATGKFHPKVTQQVLKGIVQGCRQAGCALVGGETAIMPGFYESGRGRDFSQYDLAGFCVGVVDSKKVIDGSRVREGQTLLGIASSGFHSNGYSLLRQLFSKKELQGKIGKQLLTPTQIYVKPILSLLRRVPLSAICNITGGGLIDNLPRVLPKGLTARIQTRSWSRPQIFQFVQDSGNISSFEMLRTFNMGIGMALILKNNQDVARVQQHLKQYRLKSWVIGEIIKGNQMEVA